MSLQSRVVSSRYRTRTGFTLLEVLIATAVTLLMMLSLTKIFKVIGDSMKQGRAALELNNRLRGVSLRINSDLQNLTAVPNPPADPSSGQGYMKIFDGSVTDFSANSLSTTLSRIGDVDDIFMGTARAGDVWFTGKVPRYILTGSDPVTPADFALVTIASQHAEIVAYVQPLVTNVGNESRDPNHYLTASPNGAVAFQDVDGNGFPDAFRLHYRTLLIRPDLNLPANLSVSSLGVTIPAGVLPAGQGLNAAGQTVRWTLAQPSTNPPLPSPLCDMASAHQQCDLSMRRVFGSGPGGYDYVAANSLEDLVDPANRFAHIQVPIPGTASTTMPLLALGPAFAINTGGPIPDPLGTLSTSSNPNSFEVGSGFLHPAYALRGSRAGEDLLASDILAFDIKGYDPGAPLLASVGVDLQPGVAGFDDDGVGGVDNLSEVGWAGSDDLVLSPNDPGYGAILGSVPIGAGEYVDLCWARKTARSVLVAGGTIPATANLWSQLSGFSANNFANNGVARAFTDSLYRSGSVITTTNPMAQVLQPAYDTWDSRLEGDGFLQANRSGREGVVRINGNASLYGGGGNDITNALPAWRRTSIDAGTDGIDNNGTTGVDDPDELETFPPYPVSLRGMKISIRMEDPATRQVRQMSVAKEFVTQ